MLVFQVLRRGYSVFVVSALTESVIKMKRFKRGQCSNNSFSRLTGTQWIFGLMTKRHFSCVVRTPWSRCVKCWEVRWPDWSSSEGVWHYLQERWRLCHVKRRLSPTACPAESVRVKPASSKICSVCAHNISLLISRVFSRRCILTWKNTPHEYDRLISKQEQNDKDDVTWNKNS